jgi:hypothetical protein
MQTNLVKIETDSLKVVRHGQAALIEIESINEHNSELKFTNYLTENQDKSVWELKTNTTGLSLDYKLTGEDDKHIVSINNVNPENNMTILNVIGIPPLKTNNTSGMLVINGDGNIRENITNNHDFSPTTEYIPIITGIDKIKFWNYLNPENTETTQAFDPQTLIDAGWEDCVIMRQGFPAGVDVLRVLMHIMQWIKGRD